MRNGLYEKCYMQGMRRESMKKENTFRKKSNSNKFRMVMVYGLLAIVLLVGASIALAAEESTTLGVGVTASAGKESTNGKESTSVTSTTNTETNTGGVQVTSTTTGTTNTETTTTDHPQEQKTAATTITTTTNAGVDEKTLASFDLAVGESYTTQTAGTNITVTYNTLLGVGECVNAIDNTSGCQIKNAANVTVTESSAAGSQTSSYVIREEGRINVKGDYWLEVKDITTTRASFKLKTYTPEKDIEKNTTSTTDYNCPQGCRATDEGCLCPKIVVNKDNNEYKIESEGKTTVSASEITISPGDESLTAKSTDGQVVKLGGGNLQEGIEIPVEGHAAVAIATDKNKLLTYISDENVSAQTRETLVSDQNGLAVKTVNGNKNIKVLPAEASIRAREVLNATFGGIELKVDNGRPVYAVQGEENAKLLLIIPIKEHVTAHIDAENGAVINVQRPWYSFLTAGTHIEASANTTATA